MRPRVQWICAPCAERLDGEMAEDHVATWHYGQCGACGNLVNVTEPRDFRWPSIPSQGVAK